MTTLKPGDWATYAPDSLDNVTGTWVARIGRTFLVVAGVTNDSRVVVYDDETGDMLYPRAESMKPAASPILAAVTDLAATLRRDADELDSGVTKLLADGHNTAAAYRDGETDGIRHAITKLDAIIRTHKGG